MAGFYGADVEQLRVLSRELQIQADLLVAASGRLHGRVSEMSWRGPAGERFRSDWSESLAPSIRIAADALAGASLAVARNAEDQAIASGGSPSSTSPTAESFSHGMQSGPGGNLVWRDGIRGWDLRDEVEGFLDKTIPGLPWSTADVGPLIPGLGNVLDIWSYVDTISRGEVPMHEMLGSLAGSLRGSGNLTMYWAGAAISSVDTLVHEAVKADWSKETFEANAAFLRSNPADAIDAAGDAVVKFIPDVVKIF